MPIILDLLIKSIERILSIAVVGYVVLTYFASPNNSIRIALGNIFEPIFDAIRKILPPIKGIDFSPLVVLLVIQLFYIIGHQIIRASLP